MRTDRRKASHRLLAVWAQCVRMDDELECLAADLPDPVSISTDADRAAVENIRQVLTSIAVRTVAMVRGCTPVIRSGRLVRCHVPSMRPREVKTAETFLPSVATIWLKFTPFRVACIALCVLAQISTLLVLAGVVQHWAFVWISILALPTFVFAIACLSKSVALQLAYTFQALYICGASLFFVSTLFFLLRNQPPKLVALWPLSFTLLASVTLDGYPESGRKITQRFYYVMMLGTLIALQMCIVFNLLDIVEVAVQPVSWSSWTFKISDLTSAALSSLMPFAFRNLVASCRNGDALVAVKSDVVSVRLDLCCLVILETAHSLLALEASGQNNTMKRVLTARRGSIEGLSKRASTLNHRQSRMLSSSESPRMLPIVVPDETRQLGSGSDPQPKLAQDSSLTPFDAKLLGADLP